jgi:protein O-mannosyl-transferase
VTNIVGRADLLATGFVLLGLLLYIRATTAAGWRRAGCLVAVALSAGLGLLCKESAVVLVGAVVVYDVVTFGSRPRMRWLVLLPPLAGVLFLRAWVFSRLAVPYVSFLDNPLVHADLVTRELVALEALARYLALLVWPETLSCAYSYAQVPLVGWQVAAGAVALAALLALALRGERALAFFVLFSLVAWFPVSNVLVTIGTIMAERLLYLPSIGFAAGLALGIDAVARRMWPARATLLAGTMIGLVAVAQGARPIARNADWHDSTRLWTSAVRAAPRSFETHLALAEVLFANGASEGAVLDRVIAEMERSHAIIEERPLPLRDKAGLVPLDLGIYYRAKGDELDADTPEDAEPTPAARAWYARSAEVLADAARIDAAVDEENRERELARGRPPEDIVDVGNYAIHQQLGVTMLRLGRPADAIAAFTAMRHLAPNLPASHVNLARLPRGR